MPYRQSFGGDSWEPVGLSRLPARIRDDEYYFEEEYDDDYEDWLNETDISFARDYSGKNAFLYYDREWRKWKCTCRTYQNKGSCFHTSRMRSEEVVTPNAKYL